MIDQQLIDDLKERAKKGDASVLRSPEFKSLFDAIKTIDANKRSGYGQAVNQLRAELSEILADQGDQETALPPIDITAPYDANLTADQKPKLLPTEQGTIHPLMRELDSILDIFYRMGFTAVESREIDDDFHMFGSLNFPEGHPARDVYDSFMTVQ